jgi:uncharacterized protein (TIGR02266 family)
MSKNDEQCNRGNEPRFEVELLVYYGLEPHNLRADFSVNLSTGGVFLATTDVLPVDTNLFIMFKLPGNDKIIKCNSRVAWTLDLGSFKKPSLPSGMGLQFINYTMETLRAIRDFIDTNDLVPAL